MKSSKFQFLNPNLVEMNFVLKKDSSVNSNVEVEMKNIFSVNIKRYKGQNKANVSLKLECNKENLMAPFELSITVASDFKWEDLDEKTVETMLNYNAPALLLSYMRPIVANITNSAGLPVYNLPFISFK